jgi:hypothetical protein
VGPVARAHGIVGTTEKRLNDATGAKSPDHKSPWAASYTAAAAPQPAFSLAANFPQEDEKRTVKMVLRATAALPRVVIELLDHHAVAVATVTKALPASGRLVVTLTPPRRAEGLRVRIGEFMMEDLSPGPGSSVGLSSGGLSIDADDWKDTN